MFTPLLNAVACGGGAPAIQVELFDDFASFTNREHPDNRIGYRFHEHLPLVDGDTPRSGSDREVGEAANAVEIRRFAARPGAKVFHRPVGEEGWIPQNWSFHLAPVEDGVDLLLAVETGESGLPEFYSIQQCFRLTGKSNTAWRQKYARTAAFSEFDLWQRADAAKTSLTSVLRNGVLQSLPAQNETVGCRTPYGETIDRRRSGGRIGTLGEVGPYHARMLWTADSGLILRTSRDQEWSTGLYWERTTHLSDHHPADCLHAIVNIGGVPAHSQRILRGKIYWVPGAGPDLVAHWRRDYPVAG